MSNMRTKLAEIFFGKRGGGGPNSNVMENEQTDIDMGDKAIHT
jgi:hypothetical protein